jgi:AraC-like DNA-binding protein
MNQPKSDQKAIMPAKAIPPSKNTRDYFVSASYANLVLHTLGDNEQTQAAFEHYGISKEALEDPTAQIEFEILQKAVFELLEELQLKDAGLSIGTKLHVSSHGTLGMALISAKTVGQAIEDAARYYKTAVNFADMELYYDGGFVVIELIANYDNVDVLRIVVEALMLTLQNALEFVTGKPLDSARVVFSYPPPDYAADYGRYFSGEVRFNGDKNKMMLPKAIMDMRCIGGDEQIHRLAEEQLQQKMQDIRDNNLTVQHVLTLMRRSPAAVPGLDDLAKIFNVSSRTMIRHFQAEGTNYRELRDRVHKELATEALRNTDHSVESIAMDIGYKDTASFRRAFKRWCSCTPSEYRNQHSSK